MQNLVKVTLKTTRCNAEIRNGKLMNWYYEWVNNQIIAYSKSKKTSKSKDVFDLLSDSSELNLGFLIDALTICANQEINTSIVISTRANINLYIINNVEIITSFDEAEKYCKSHHSAMSASEIGEEIPKMIDSGTTVTLDKNQLELMSHCLDFMKTKIKYTNNELKLLNYWRRGVDLDLLSYPDESYLAFFKILEFFQNKSSAPSRTNPFNKKRQKALYDAYKIADGAGLSKVTNGQYKMLSSFVFIRNNFDVAHVKMKNLSGRGMGRLYYSYDYWEYHSDICQVSRLLIFKYMNLKGIMLHNDGGLLALAFDR